MKYLLYSAIFFDNKQVEILRLLNEIINYYNDSFEEKEQFVYEIGYCGDNWFDLKIYFETKNNDMRLSIIIINDFVKQLDKLQLGED